jgi:hypothetical protein
MNLSTIIMPCNNTGYTDPATTKGWGIIDFGAAPPPAPPPLVDPPCIALPDHPPCHPPHCRLEQWQRHGHRGRLGKAQADGRRGNAVQAGEDDDGRIQGDDGLGL